MREKLEKTRQKHPEKKGHPTKVLFFNLLQKCVVPRTGIEPALPYEN